jgi:hypothetical protein
VGFRGSGPAPRTAVLTSEPRREALGLLHDGTGWLRCGFQVLIKSAADRQIGE